MNKEAQYPDREKVIKGLECHVKGECAECPYREGWHTCNPTPESGLFADAIVLLKTQEPVKPIPGLWDRDIQLFICGVCGGEIGAGGIAKYCLHCGKAVKWE